jgi:hypothetical protein
MKDFSFVDETVDLNRAHAYRLSIQVSLNGFSFSILDMVRGKFVVLKHYDLSPMSNHDQKADKVKQILASDKHLQPSFKESVALVVTRKSTLMPASYFQSENLKSYLAFNHDLDELDELHFNPLQEIDAYDVFTIPNPLSNTILDHFGKIPYYHHGLPFLHYHLDNASGARKIAALSIFEGFIDIGVFSENNLLFYNTFQWSTHEDILYYLLYVYKQLKLDVSSNELYICGSTGDQKDLKKLIDQYIKKSHLQRPPNDFTYSYTFKNEQTHHFTNLFRLNLCV